MADNSGSRASQIKSIDKHGTSSQIQMSDGTGTTGHLAAFASDGSLTDGGAPGAGAATPVRETPGGTLNGTNVSFTLSNTPTAASLLLFLNGVEQDPSRWYTLSGNTITYTVAPKAADLHLAWYTH